jgi:four helix bundle protein
MKYQGPVHEKSFEFALSIIRLYKKLIGHNEYIISKQLLKSGTSIGANISESSAAESRNDFKHKMAVASKEARESLYWLWLLKKGNLVDVNVDNEINDCEELVRLLTSIVKTTTQKTSL